MEESFRSPNIEQTHQEIIFEATTFFLSLLMQINNYLPDPVDSMRLAVFTVSPNRQ